MVTSLKCSYPGLSSETMTDIMDNIQKSIRQKVSFSFESSSSQNKSDQFCSKNIEY